MRDMHPFFIPNWRKKKKRHGSKSTINQLSDVNSETFVYCTNHDPMLNFSSARLNMINTTTGDLRLKSSGVHSNLYI